MVLDNADYFLLGLAFGWCCGGMFVWVYFVTNRLVRSRKEWYADRRARGLGVPDDWDREDTT